MNLHCVPRVKKRVVRYGLTLAMLTLVGVGCLGGSTAVPSSLRPSSGSQPLGVALPTVDVLVRVQSTHPSYQFGFNVRCPGDNALLPVAIRVHGARIALCLPSRPGPAAGVG